MTSCLLSVFSLILYTILDQYKRSGLFFGILRPPYFENIRWNRSEGYTHNLLPIALSYASIFDTLWKQGELYEQLKAYSIAQKEFINISAHELRTPIQPILGLSEVLHDKIKDTKQIQLLDTITRNAKRLQRLTDDILDVSKIESQSLKLNKERFNLNDVITNVIDEMMINRSESKNEKNDDDNNNNIKLDYRPKDIFVEADRVRVTQVISNILSNAVKFTKGKGSMIFITIEKKQNQEVIVKIKDTGTGIDPEILPRLFSKFASKSYQGTGLGLYISKGIIESHGGRIWAENNADERGATFSFSLPVSKQQPVSADT
jgi:two-component system, OmpR family, sensor histidine kinase VicK